MKRITQALATLALLAIGACLTVKAQSTAPAYNLNPVSCEVTQYPYATYAWCDDAATNAPGIANVSVFLKALPDGTLDPSSNVEFCTGVTPTTPYCTYVDEPLSGTLIDLQLHGAFSGQYTGTVAFQIFKNIGRYGRVRYNTGVGSVTVN